MVKKENRQKNKPQSINPKHKKPKNDQNEILQKERVISDLIVQLCV